MSLLPGAARLLAILALIVAGAGRTASGACAIATIMSPLGQSASPPQFSISGDGRYTAFVSADINLVPNDTNGIVDVFVFDRQTCGVERVSVDSNENQATVAGSSHPSISGDGRFVAFRSLGFGLLNGAIYVRDRLLGTTVLASSPNGTQNPPGCCFNRSPSISGDGRYVAFWSDAANLVAADTNNEWDVFVRDLATSATVRVSVATGGIQAHGEEPCCDNFSTALSNDGRFVVFSSSKFDLIAGDGNAARDVFRHDRQTGTTVRVSVTDAGAESPGHANQPVVSGDGRHVAFVSSTSLITGDGSLPARVYVRDVDAGVTSRVAVLGHGDPSVYSNRPSISGDGRYVAFETTSVALAPGCLCGSIFVRDRLLSITRPLGIGPGGSTDGGAFMPVLSGDGQFVAFGSTDDDLVPGDTNGVSDLFVSNWPVLPIAAGNLMQNGDFSGGLPPWTVFALPIASDIVWQADGDVLEFYRRSGSKQAVVLQSAAVPLLKGTPLRLQFELGNSSAARKRVSVLIHDSSFSDLHVCTFWLEPQAPMRSYGMRTYTTAIWSHPTVAFYAATGDGLPWYVVDNVSLVFDPLTPDLKTDCEDPTAPGPIVGGETGPNLLANSDFSGGAASWTTFGQIVWQIAAGVFEFYRPATDPAGVVFQETGQMIATGEIMTARFKLGNSSPARKRVTLLLHDRDFSDLSACTFWIAPGAPLSEYVVRAFATEPWTNATLSLYAATIDVLPWIRFDDAVLQRTPTEVISGTECLEPTPATQFSSTATIAATSGGRRAPTSEPVAARPMIVEPRAPGRVTQLPEPAPAASAWSVSRPVIDDSGYLWVRVPPSEVAIEVQVSLDDVNWRTMAVLPAARDWRTLAIDLGPFVGPHVYVRLVVR